MGVSLRFYGSGNAFADGGRSHACIHVTAPGVSLLLDCGGSSLPLIKRYTDPALITAVAVTHLHGDHFGGIPFLLDEQRWRFRKTPIVLAGPPSLEKRVKMVAAGYGMEVSPSSLGFDAPYVVLDRTPREIAGARVAAVPVTHSPSAEPHGLRVAVDGKLIAYSGDACWSDALVELADGADLFVCEATNFTVADEVANPVHISYETLMKRRGELRCDRMVLTHLGANTLAHLAELQTQVAVDGLSIAL